MSFKSRKIKSFLRYIEQLKELPIYSINQYIVIDESYLYYKKNNICIDFKSKNKELYKEYLLSGEIKSSLDFDNYFNPDLTLDLNFEKNPTKRDGLIKNSLVQIGQRWNERLKKKFPSQDFTIVLYFNVEDMEWHLDFLNGSVDLDELDHLNQCKSIAYLNE